MLETKPRSVEDRHKGKAGEKGPKFLLDYISVFRIKDLLSFQDLWEPGFVLRLQNGETFYISIYNLVLIDSPFHY